MVRRCLVDLKGAVDLFDQNESSDLVGERHFGKRDEASGSVFKKEGALQRLQ